MFDDANLMVSGNHVFKHLVFFFCGGVCGVVFFYFLGGGGYFSAGRRAGRPAGPARTAADLVFVLAPKVIQNGAMLLLK